MATDNSKVMILNCIIPDDNFKDIFTLEISQDKMVNQLKPMIRKWQPNRFQHINPSKLILYKALSENMALVFLKTLKKEKGNKNYEQHLPSLEKIHIHFSNDQETYSASIKPNENRVSIVICPLDDNQKLFIHSIMQRQALATKYSHAKRLNGQFLCIVGWFLTTFLFHK